MTTLFTIAFAIIGVITVVSWYIRFQLKRILVTLSRVQEVADQMDDMDKEVDNA